MFKSDIAGTESGSGANAHCPSSDNRSRKAMFESVRLGRRSDGVAFVSLGFYS